MPRRRTKASKDDDNNPLIGYGRRMPLPRIYPYQPTGSQPRRSKLPSFTPLIHGDNHTVISNTGTVYNNNNNDNWKDVDDEGNSKGIINQNHVFEDIDLTDIRCRLENLINADIKNILPAKFDEEWLQFNLEYNKRDLE
ncbi:hypothetical protein QR685DRAFT_542479 [Neurospora intermedia]|uniref:Uncharacterized protein n=1 Tax=Neurospora intermedia TaxID=5142 RepID=A0ABR3DMW4_NEUIN